jgi:hypothetical protein
LFACASDEPRTELGAESARGETTTTVAPRRARLGCEPGVWPDDMFGRAVAANPLAVGKPAPLLPEVTVLLWRTEDGFRVRLYDKTSAPAITAITIKAKGTLLVPRWVGPRVRSLDVEEGDNGTTVTYEVRPVRGWLHGFDFVACGASEFEISVSNNGTPLRPENVFVGQRDRLTKNPQTFARE